MIEDFQYTTEATRIRIKDSFDLKTYSGFSLFGVIEDGKMFEEIGTCFSMN